MSALLTDALFLPALVLAILAFSVPRLLARLLPEGVRPLLLNAFLSSIFLFVLSAAFFALLYWLQGVSLVDITDYGLAENVVFFGRLGLIAALIWAPILLLSVAGLPRKWVKETW